MYASSAVMGKGVDEMGTEFDKACLSTDPLVFTYDAENNALSTKGIMMIHKSVDDDRSTNIFDTYRYALINAWDKRPAAVVVHALVYHHDARGEAPAACSSR